MVGKLRASHLLGLLLCASTGFGCGDETRADSSRDTDAALDGEAQTSADGAVSDDADSALDASSSADATVVDAAQSDATTPDAGPADASKPDAAPPPPCTVQVPTECPDPPVRYEHVAPIILERCGSCHYTGNNLGYWPIDSYKHATDWFDIIPPVLANCTMPPPEANLPVPKQDAELILAWFACGHPL